MTLYHLGNKFIFSLFSYIVGDMLICFRVCSQLKKAGKSFLISLFYLYLNVCDSVNQRHISAWFWFSFPFTPGVVGLCSIIFLCIKHLKRLINRVTYAINESVVLVITAYLKQFSKNSFTYLSMPLVSEKILVEFLKQSHLKLVLESWAQQIFDNCLIYVKR